MGCLFSRGNDQDGSKEEEQPKVYSWDKKDRPDPKDFTIAELKGETVGRLPGTVNGQQFIINNCQDCNIYIFDHSASVTIDDCIGCKIFIGPSKGSVFLRDCSQCKAVIACQQFRSRDCKGIDIMLYCDTQPIIESTTKIRFGCFHYFYPELKDQFASSGLSAYNNNWSNIHDFSPVPGEENWSLIPEEVTVADILPNPDTENFSQMKISTEASDSVVPLTHGKRRRIADEFCLILFFHKDNVDETMKKFILNLKNEESILLESKQLQIHYEDISRIFGELPYLKEVAKAGPVTALQFNGKDVVQKCQAFVKDLGTEVPTYVSSDPERAKKDIENWKNFVEAQFSM